MAVAVCVTGSLELSAVRPVGKACRPKLDGLKETFLTLTAAVC